MKETTTNNRKTYNAELPKYMQKKEDTTDLKYSKTMWKMRQTWKTSGATSSTCQEVVGHEKLQYKEWITAEVMQKTEVRKHMRAKLNNSHT